MPVVYVRLEKPDASDFLTNQILMKSHNLPLSDQFTEIQLVILWQ
jgi:hypothetical protein